MACTWNQLGTGTHTAGSQTTQETRSLPTHVQKKVTHFHFQFEPGMHSHYITINLQVCI